MTYEWEGRIPDDLLERIDAVLVEHGLALAGLAVFNLETVEGALVHAFEPADSMERADMWRDVMGDVDRFYQAARGDMREEYEGRARPN